MDLIMNFGSTQFFSGYIKSSWWGYNRRVPKKLLKKEFFTVRRHFYVFPGNFCERTLILRPSMSAAFFLLSCFLSLSAVFFCHQCRKKQGKKIWLKKSVATFATKKIFFPCFFRHQGEKRANKEKNSLTGQNS